MGRLISALHVKGEGSSLGVRFGAINKKTWGKKTSELDLFGYIGMSPSVFAAVYLRSVTAAGHHDHSLPLQKLCDCRWFS